MTRAAMLTSWLAALLLLGPAASAQQSIAPAIGQIPSIQAVPIVPPSGPSLGAGLGTTFSPVTLSPSLGVPALPVPVEVRRAQAVPQPGDGRLAGRQLLEQLHEQTGRGYRDHGYDDSRHFMFSTADNVTVNGRKGVIDAYSGVFVAGEGPDPTRYRENGDQNGDGWVDKGGMNIEHTWPQSFFNKGLPMKADMHHLLPTFIHPNEIRGHMPFGEVRGRPEYANSGGAKMGQGVFEPPDAVKGRVARAVLYFYTRYYDRNITQGGFDDSFWNDRIDMLLRWNRDFPPNADEKARNVLVERFQGNRNPFIDDPSLADRVGADGFKRPGRWGMGYGYKNRPPR